MRYAPLFGILMASFAAISTAQASVITGVSPDPAEPGITGKTATLGTSTLAQVDNEDYTGAFAANPNQLTFSFTYNDTYLAAPIPVFFRGATRDTINDGGAKEFTVNFNVTNNSSRALEEMTFVLNAPTSPTADLDFENTPPPTSPLTGFARPTPQILKFGFLGGASTLAPAATGSFIFGLDIPDLSNGTFTLSAQVTPEPASIALAMAVSLVGGGIGIRRRRRQQPDTAEALAV